MKAFLQFGIKMKLILCVVILFGLLLQKRETSCALVDAPDILDASGCLSSLKRDTEEFLEIVNIELPKTRASKCAYDCMLRSGGIVNDNGLIKVQKLKDSLKALSMKNQSLKSIAAIMKHCNGYTHLSIDTCETTGLLLKCAVQEGEKRGWTSAQIIALIRNPYFPANKNMIAEVISVRPITTP